MEKTRISRRQFLTLASTASGAALLAACTVPTAPLPAGEEAAAPTQETVELVHWGNADVWFEMVMEPVNEILADEGIWIDNVAVPSDQRLVKHRSAAAAGISAVDFFWDAAGANLGLILDGLAVPLDEPLADAGLDWADFFPERLDECGYRGKTWLMPTDQSNFAMFINGVHAEEAGLDLANLPQTREDFLEWADKMTVREGDKVTRSGFLLTGTNAGILADWSIIANSLGAQIWNDDFTEVNVTSQECAESAQFLLDCFDEYKISSRDVTERYQTHGRGGVWHVLDGVLDGRHLRSRRGAQYARSIHSPDRAHSIYPRLYRRADDGQAAWPADGSGQAARHCYRHEGDLGHGYRVEQSGRARSHLPQIAFREAGLPGWDRSLGNSKGLCGSEQERPSLLAAALVW
ncbi:ABC transporter substrate-binding protein [Candidatus Entotheonella palauensis]|uniref:ABC transporter substrate-binding protein n=1 Tax=Candidatus Entotheonella palauensis TaxID=93172 RepID=UPI0015C46751|nr:extracellular solute-binding protein [Candidatus Entotheonella palauensis]